MKDKTPSFDNDNVPYEERLLTKLAIVIGVGEEEAQLIVLTSSPLEFLTSRRYWLVTVVGIPLIGTLANTDARNSDMSLVFHTLLLNPKATATVPTPEDTTLTF